MKNGRLNELRKTEKATESGVAMISQNVAGEWLTVDVVWCLTLPVLLDIFG